MDTNTLPKNPWPRTAPCWIYDEIMRHLNPDLMLTHIPLLSKIYDGETAEEREERMDSYEKAYALYDQAYLQVSDLCATESYRIKEQAHNQALQRENVERSGDILSVEEKINSFFSNP